MLGDFGQHLGADFDGIVERPSGLALCRVAELNVGTAGAALHGPSAA